MKRLAGLWSLRGHSARSAWLGCLEIAQLCWALEIGRSGRLRLVGCPKVDVLKRPEFPAPFKTDNKYQRQHLYPKQILNVLQSIVNFWVIVFAFVDQLVFSPNRVRVSGSFFGFLAVLIEGRRCSPDLAQSSEQVRQVIAQI